MSLESELKEQFESRASYLEALGRSVIKTIESQLKNDLIAESKLSPCDELVPTFLKIPTSLRVKDTDSFLEKALFRKPKDNPLEEITDQVGVRFVVLLQRDVCRIDKIIQNQTVWEVRKDRDFEYERLQKPDYFAYQSDHFIIFNNNTFHFDGILIPERTPCEIQVRTLLQHAYAEMAHDTDYKPSLCLPSEKSRVVRRSLAKGSALIETTDTIFNDIRDKLDSYDAQIKILLNECSVIYEEYIKEKAPTFTVLSQVIVDKYREILADIDSECLREFYSENKVVPSIIFQVQKKRDLNVIYRNSIIILIYYLINNNTSLMKNNWPIDNSYLRDFFVDLGISPEAYGL